MAAPKRPTLTHLAVPKAAQPAPQVEAAPTPPVDTPAAPQASAPSGKRVPTPRRAPQDMKTVQVRINKRGWMALRNLASDKDLSLEALMVEALNDALLKHQQPPIVERRTGERGTEGIEAE
ncbi:ribbon-helix-helix domain-containing protein [Methylobacterium sp. Leaf113]|uniref:ribbon-helix-helix domain-containing protein n=2 Tax=unclassified Methylobacterium TaxID=2615210 RepID=UPI000A9ACCD9|nr:ribbon-helix-helix domain-containing protein [Methylobacterium sp. Leaf113]